MENKTSQTKTKIIRNPRFARFLSNKVLKSVVISTLILCGIYSPVGAQKTKNTNPSWWFGAAGGANINFYQGTTQHLTTDFITPSAFHNGAGIGLFAAPLIEYHRPETRLGFMLQAGYDSRRGWFDQARTPCDIPINLNTNLDYITIEPSLRFAPFKSNFYLYAGPRFAFNLKKDFTYQKSINPDFPDIEIDPEENWEFSDTEKFLISMQVGAGIDVPLSSQHSRTKTMLSPFVSFQPYFGQDPRSIESWNITTVRAGIALKFGRSPKRIAPREVVSSVPITPTLLRFTVSSPETIPIERRVKETFPLLNHVFFNLGSTEIPDRYVLLNKDQVANFKEELLERFAPLKLSGRSKRQMSAYYNVLNIVGYRMSKAPYSTITLFGTSEKSPQDGKIMAESVKKYLVDIFRIDASRINIEMRDKPKIPSEQADGTDEQKLLNEENRRVTIESNSPTLSMEFQSGTDIRLRPVEITTIQEAPSDSYVSFNVAEGSEVLSSWSMEIKDERGEVQTFGPYTQKEISLPGKLILGDDIEGNYQVTMNGRTRSDMIVKNDTTIHLKRSTMLQDDERKRFSVIYDFDDTKAIPIYKRYLTEITVLKIPFGGSVSIHGYTDIIGDEANNLRLSLARANDIREIIEDGLSRLNRRDVRVEVNGFGEDQKLSQFENTFPEERFYNRTVIIDIFPKK